MHIDAAIEHLRDWDAVISLSRIGGEPFVSISAMVDGYEYRSAGAKIEDAVILLVASIEKQTKAKYTRPITKGKRSK